MLRRLKRAIIYLSAPASQIKPLSKRRSTHFDCPSASSLRLSLSTKTQNIRLPINLNIARQPPRSQRAGESLPNDSQSKRWAMDPLSVASTFGLLNQISRTLRVFEQLHTATNDWKRVSAAYLAITDIRLDLDHVPEILLESGKQTRYQLSNLPPQAAESCRFYIVSNPQDQAEFREHVEPIINEPFDNFCKDSDPYPSPLTRRLREEQMTWWQGGFCIFGTNLNPQGLFDRVIRCQMRTRCIWLEDRMICFIFCEPEIASYHLENYLPDSDPSPAILRDLSRFLGIFRRVNRSFSQNLVNCTNRSMHQRMVSLRLCYSVLIKNESFLSETEILYRVSLRYLDDPKRATITPDVLRIFSRDSYFREIIHQQFAVFSTAVESFLSSLQLQQDLPDLTEFRELLIEIQNQNTTLDKRVASVSNRLEDRLKFLEIARSLNETGRLQLLSLLAVIFLPLSLASSILSMQTRFVDLHYLLYDFFGVIFLLGTLTFILLGTVLLIQWTYGKFYDWMERADRKRLFTVGPRWRAGRYAPLFTIFVFSVPWVLVVASFLVGMIHNVGLGLQVLGYGSVAVVFLHVPMALLLSVRVLRS